MQPTVLFDLDGTITDSASGIRASFSHALAEVGAPAPTDELLGRIVGPPMQDTMDALFDPETAARALAAYHADYLSTGWRDNRVFAGMPQVLDAARELGLRLAVATSKIDATAHRVLEHFGLADRFAFIGGASEDGTRRAKADVIAYVLDALEIRDDAHPVAELGRHNPLLMVGDRDHDIDGAARFGIHTVAARWGYGTEAEHLLAWRVAESPAELSGVLAQFARS